MGSFETALLLSGGAYLTALVWLNLGLRRRQPPAGMEEYQVAVVVAARNEEASIGACLEALRGQDYRGPWEVVVVDDRSTDRTAQRVAEHAWPAVSLVRAPVAAPDRCPKKNALAAGIAHTRATLLLFTDADCRPAPDWVRTTVGVFGPEVGMAIGHAFPVGCASWKQRLLALDNLAVGALGAGSTGMGRPLSCTGRNLAYRREVYEQVGGFAAISHLIGGDDVYLMRLVSRTSWKIVANPAMVAGDAGPATWRAAVQQKLRHAAKAGHYRGPALWLGGMIYLYHLFLGVGLVRLALGLPSALFLAVWACRWLADLVLLWRYAAGPAQRSLLWLLPIFEVVYIPYVLFFTLAGRAGWFRWK